MNDETRKLEEIAHIGYLWMQAKYSYEEYKVINKSSKLDSDDYLQEVRKIRRQLANSVYRLRKRFEDVVGS